MTEKEPGFVWEVFAAPRRSGTFDEHRYVAVDNGRMIIGWCRDCGHRYSEWWEAEPKTKCEPDKCRPTWFIERGVGWVRQEALPAKEKV